MKTKTAAALGLLFCASVEAGYMAPGGVTYYYYDGVLDTPIRRSAVLSACLDVVPLTPPGAAVDEHGNALVYQTATNSHPHSMEVVLIYNRRAVNTPTVPHLGVYDWSIPAEQTFSRWVDVRLPFIPRGRFCYRNISRHIAGNHWANVLKVKWGGKYHTVYKRVYRATELNRLFWGPISEEFPPGASADMAPLNWKWTLKIDGRAWHGSN